MAEILAVLVKGWSMIPTRLQHWLEIGVVAGLFLLWFAAHERGIVDAQIRAESKKAEAIAEKTIADLNAKHTKEIAANEQKHQTELTAAAHSHDADLARLRQLDSQRQANALLASSITACTAQRTEDERRLTSLEQVAAGLADALRNEQGNLDFIYNDRSSLTGK